MGRLTRWLGGGGRVEPPRFTVVTRDRLTLHYPTPWPVKQQPGEFLVRCSFEVIELAELFGFTFPKPVRVYLFPTCAWLTRYYTPTLAQAAGVALFRDTAIAVALDGGNLLQIARHELAHLYADAWGDYHPAFKGEGLAVWCEYKRDRVEIDRLAGWVVKDLGYLPKLADLLSDDVFFSAEYAGCNYILAGSFTRWVVRQRGWPVYRDFFRTATRTTYAEEFIAHFGLTLAAAERGWHRHLSAAGSGVKLATRPPRWGVEE